MKAKMVPIAIITVLILFHLLAGQFHSLLRPAFFRPGAFIYSLVYLCIWSLFLYHSVKTNSRGLLMLYQVFWLAMTMLHPLIYLSFLFAMGAHSLPVGEFAMFLYIYPRVPLAGLWRFGMSEFLSFFIVPLLMFLIGVVVKRKCIK